MPETTTIKRLQIEYAVDNTKALSDIKATDSTLKKSADTAGKALDDWSSKLSTWGQRLTVGLTLPLAALGANMTRLAMDAVESESRFNAALGSMAASTRKWSEEFGKALGVNRYALRDNLSTMNAMLKGMGVTAEESAKMSQDMSALSYDLASFYNLNPNDAFRKLRSGLSGESEPLKELGVLVNETTTKLEAMSSGIIEQGEALTEVEKVQARYNLILKQTSIAQGDMARTLDSPANQLRVLKERVTELQIELGQKLLPLVEKAVDTVTPVVSWLDKSSEATKTWTVRLGMLGAAVGPVIAVVGALVNQMRSLDTVQIVHAMDAGNKLSGVKDKLDAVNSRYQAQLNNIRALRNQTAYNGGGFKIELEMTDADRAELKASVAEAKKLRAEKQQLLAQQNRLHAVTSLHTSTLRANTTATKANGSAAAIASRQWHGFATRVKAGGIALKGVLASMVTWGIVIGTVTLATYGLNYAGNRAVESLNGLSKETEVHTAKLKENAQAARQAAEELKGYIKVAASSKPQLSKDQSRVSAVTSRIKDLENTQAYYGEEYLGESDSTLKNYANVIRAWTFRRGMYKDLQNDYVSRQNELNKLYKELKTLNSKLTAEGEKVKKGFDTKIAEQQKLAIAASQRGDELAEATANAWASYWEALSSNAAQSGMDETFNKVTADTLAKQKLDADLHKVAVQDYIADRNAQHQEVIAALDEYTSLAAKQGNEYAQAIAAAERAKSDALHEAYDVDDSGNYKLSEKLRKSAHNTAINNYQAAVAKAKADEQERIKALRLEQAQNAINSKYRGLLNTSENKQLTAQFGRDKLGAELASIESNYLNKMRGYDLDIAEGKDRNSEIVNAGLERAIAEREAKLAEKQRVARTKLDEELANLSRLALDAGDRLDVGAYYDGLSQYKSEMQALNELKEEGINVTERMALAEAKYTKTLVDGVKAEEERRRKIAEDSANKVLSKINDNRQKEIDKIEEQIEARKRLRDSISFTSAESVWQSAVLAGARAQYDGGPQSRLPDINRDPTQKEIAAANQQIAYETAEHNRKLDLVIEAIKNLGGGVTL